MKRLLIGIILLLSGMSSATAATVTGYSNVLIGTNYYDVIFHPDSTFDQIWNLANPSLGVGGTPTFWDDWGSISPAALELQSRLGGDDTIDGTYDGFLIPQWLHDNPSEVGYVGAWSDFRTLGLDMLGQTSTHRAVVREGYAWVSFAPSATIVPLPAAVWLFGSGLVGLIGFSKRRKAA